MMKIRRSEITAELFLDKLADKRRREIFEEMVDRILDEGIATLARQRIIAKLFNDAHREFCTPVKSGSACNDVGRRAMREMWQ